MILSETLTQPILIMKILKRISLVVIILLFSVLIPERAAAQSLSEIQFQSVKVRLFPEFNGTSIYVICEIELADDVPTNQTIRLMIPINVQDYFAASIDQYGSLTTLELSIAYQGQWKILQFTSPSNTIRLEYNDPNLTIDGNDRYFQFNWFSFYKVENLSLQVQGAVNAGELQSYPKLDKFQENGNNRPYYRITNGPFREEKLVTFNFWYTENASPLTNPAQQVEMGAEISENTPGRPPSPIKLLVWFLVVEFSLIILIGVYYFWVRKKTEIRREHMYDGLGIINPEKQFVFCHECGKRSSPGDKFCSNCGTELRETPRPY